MLIGAPFTHSWLQFCNGSWFRICQHHGFELQTRNIFCATMKSEKEKTENLFRWTSGCWTAAGRWSGSNYQLLQNTAGGSCKWSHALNFFHWGQNQSVNMILAIFFSFQQCNEGEGGVREHLNCHFNIGQQFHHRAGGDQQVATFDTICGIQMQIFPVFQMPCF